MGEPLPEFPYHPDPLGTGFVERSGAPCAGCGRERGLIYTGPVYALEELIDCLCPWCIADGSAAARFDATFTDDEPVADGVQRVVVDIVTKRTPGFSGWQQEHWLYHCGDGAAFLGRAGWAELEDLPDALEVLRHEHVEYGWTPELIEEYLRELDKDGSPCAYLFRCRHCAPISPTRTSTREGSDDLRGDDRDAARLARRELEVAIRTDDGIVVAHMAGELAAGSDLSARGEAGPIFFQLGTIGERGFFIGESDFRTGWWVDKERTLLGVSVGQVQLLIDAHA